MAANAKLCRDTGNTRLGHHGGVAAFASSQALGRTGRSSGTIRRWLTRKIVRIRYERALATTASWRCPGERITRTPEGLTAYSRP